MDLSHSQTTSLPISLSLANVFIFVAVILTDCRGSSLDDSSSLFTRFPKHCCWRTEPPASGNKWLLSADKQSYSETHEDAAGYATLIIVILGLKLWIIALGPVDQLPLNDSGWDIEKMQFQIVAIGEQEKL